MLKRQQPAAFIALAAIAAMTGAGCGSSSNTDTAHIRAVNVAPNAGSAAVTVNGGAVDGTLNFAQISTYNYIGQGDSIFSFTTTTTLPTNITIPPSPHLTLSTGSYYTSYLIGRTDVQGEADPRFLQTVVTGDRGASANYASPALYTNPPTGEANIRILNAAPDARSVDVLINGAVTYAAAAYPKFPVVEAVNPVTAYLPLPISGIKVQVNVAGTATVLVPATSVSVSSGNAYTIVVTEPTVTPTPTYGLLTVGDQP